MDEKLQGVLVDTIRTAELRTGRKFDLGAACEVLRCSINKLRYIRMDMDHLPLLFEDGMRDQEEINEKGVEKHVRHLPPVPVS